jgi:hypothetical protein
MSSLVSLVIEAEQVGLLTGPMKKSWVLDQLKDMDQNQASLLIDDMVAVLNSPSTIKLFHDTSTICLRWCCRGK